MMGARSNPGGIASPPMGIIEPKACGALPDLPQADTARRLADVLVGQLAVSESDIGPGVLLVPSSVDRDLPSLGADSLDVVELAMAVEEEFNIQISDDEAEAFNRFTVAQLVDFVHARVGDAS